MIDIEEYDREIKKLQEECNHPEQKRIYNTADDAKWACTQCGDVKY